MADEKAQMAEFGIETVYLKKLDFSIQKPAYAYRDKWKPEAKVELNSKHNKLEGTLYDVVMTVNVSVKMEGPPSRSINRVGRSKTNSTSCRSII